MITNAILVYKFITNTKKDKNYYRNTEDLVDITLAESMIDGKINSKNLIMSVIVDQINCGNIIMDNDKLILKKYDEIPEIKKEIIDMFFSQENAISLNELSNVFTDNNKTDKIMKEFRKIKK